MAFERNMTNFLRVAKSLVEPNDLLGTILIINEARENLKDKKDGLLLDPSKLMFEVYEASKALKLPIKTFNERVYCDLLELLPDNVDWVNVYERLADGTSAKVIVSKAIKNDFCVAKDAQNALIVEGEKFVAFIKEIVNEHMDTKFTVTTGTREATCVLKNIFPGATLDDNFIDSVNDREYESYLKKDIKHYYNVRIVEQKAARFGRYDSSFNNSKYDCILACPPIRGKELQENIYGYSEWIGREFDTIAFQQLPMFLNNNGILSILMPGRIQFAGNKIAFLRSYMQEKYNVRKVEEIPAGILKGTGVRLALIQVQNNSNKDNVEVISYKSIVPSKFNDNIDKLEVQDHVLVDYNEFVSAQSWQIGRFFTYEDDEISRFHKSEITRKKIGEVADVFRGRSINVQEKGKDDGEYTVINVSNIGDYRVNFTDLVKIDDSGSTVTKYILKDGDILIPARGTVIRAAVFEEQDFKCIASSNVIVIRSKSDKINSTYLKAFLGSPLGKKLVENNQIGGSFININYKELASMEIPCPDLAIQNEVAEKFKLGLKEYEEVTKAANEKWDSVLNGIYNEWS